MTSLSSELGEGELAALREAVSLHSRDGKILEIGTAAGGTFVEMVDAARISGAPEAAGFVVVDTFEYFTGHLDIWRKNLEEHGIDPDSVDVRRGDSYAIFKESACESGEEYSFILIDASHQLKNMIRDLRWLERLKAGGGAAFHDYSELFPGVQIAVRTLLSRNKNYRAIRLVDTLLFIEKTAASKGREIPPVTIFARTMHSRFLSLKRSAMKRLKRLGFYRDRPLIEA